MNPKEIFLNRFVDQFYRKSKRKRRTSKNIAYDVPYIINNISRKYFDGVKFEEKEVFEAFKQNGYLFITSGQEEFTWERFHSGHILILNDLFINLDSQCNSDLRLIMRDSFPDNFKTNTVDKLNSLKSQMRSFWETNMNLLV